jgi:hypothetical protein
MDIRPESTTERVAYYLDDLPKYRVHFIGDLPDPFALKLHEISPISQKPGDAPRMGRMACLLIVHFAKQRG